MALIRISLAVCSEKGVIELILVIFIKVVSIILCEMGLLHKVHASLLEGSDCPSSLVESGAIPSRSV